ncbi:TIGR02444 family protein [Pseudomonas sp. H9]|uniref:TIGR02444 family protein n=1 Tax=Pseudomonas sp. H9 TaxID=483968 RepID=UPI0010582AB1|nr:TIGR02444 family protein [Pseudomonas sp. H9]TDF83432.1 TIGR02444 family protein [Pseudomonas sp. H9]
MHTDLWNFALNLYARPGVEAACLQWQDQGGDVCLLLCAAWLNTRGIAPTEQRMQALRERAAAWQLGVITPLRNLRQQWRTAASQDPQLAHLREQVKGLELNAERILLERLQEICDDWLAASEPAADWLNYLTPEGTSAHHDARHTLRVAMQSTQEAEDGV